MSFRCTLVRTNMVSTGTEINRGPVAHGPQILVWATKLLPIIQLNIQTFLIKNLVCATSLNFPISIPEVVFQTISTDLNLGDTEHCPSIEILIYLFDSIPGTSACCTFFFIVGGYYKVEVCQKSVILQDMWTNN